MKRFLVFALVLCMVTACVPALALEATDIFGAYDDNGRGYWEPPFDHSQWKKMIGFDLKQAGSGRIFVRSRLLFSKVIQRDI